MNMNNPSSISPSSISPSNFLQSNTPSVDIKNHPLQVDNVLKHFTNINNLNDINQLNFNDYDNIYHAIYNAHNNIKDIGHERGFIESFDLLNESEYPVI